MKKNKNTNSRPTFSVSAQSSWPNVMNKDVNVRVRENYRVIIEMGKRLAATAAETELSVHIWTEWSPEDGPDLQQN